MQPVGFQSHFQFRFRGSKSEQYAKPSLVAQDRTVIASPSQLFQEQRDGRAVGGRGHGWALEDLSNLSAAETRKEVLGDLA